MGRYDSSLTVFSPEGHLIQVEHAHRAVEHGTAAVAVRCRDCVVLAVERKQVARLQDPTSVQKIFDVDEHTVVTYAGLTADARVLIDRARLESQSYRLTYGAPPSVERLSRTVAGVLQEHTQSGGTRPFGVSLIITGKDGTGYHVFQCDPSGVYMEWKALAVGNNSKTLMEYMEKAFQEKEPETEAEALELVKGALGEITESIDEDVQIRIVK